MTKFQDNEECSCVSNKVCDPVTRQECENIKENMPMPMQTLEQRCETKHVEECSKPGTPTTMAASYMLMMPLSAPPTRRPLGRPESPMPQAPQETKEKILTIIKVTQLELQEDSS